MVRIGAMRIVAALIDFIIAGVAAFIVRIIILIPFHGYLGVLLSDLLGSGVVLAYFYLEVLKGQAIGKMIFKYQITDQNGGPASQEALTKRYVIKMSAWIVSAVVGFFGFSVILLMLASLVNLAVAVAVLVMGLMLLRQNCLAYWDELAGTAVFGPGTVQAGFPVMQQAAPSSAASVPPGPPPAA